MKHFFKIFIAAIISLSLAGKLLAALPSYKEALAEAKEKDKDILVLCVGSDWLLESKEFVTAFENVKRKTPNSNIIWAIYDNKNYVSAEERNANGNPPITIWSYPGIIYTDKFGRPIDYREKASEKMIAAVGKFIEICKKRRQERDNAWKKADSAKGIERAKLIGQGFDCFLDKLSDIKMRGIADKYKNKIEDIKRADGNDNSGYYFKYTFWYLPFMKDYVNKKCGEKKFSEVYAYIDSKLTIPVLTKHQQQQLIVGKYRTARLEGKMHEAVKFLEEAAKINPKSEFGQACLRQKRYYTAPVRLESLEWSGRESRPEWTKTSVVVSKEIQKPGNYSVEFKHRGGYTKFRDLKVTSGGKILAEVPGEKWKFEFNLPKIGGNKEIILEFEMRGTGWFDGNGEIIVKPR